MASGSRTFSSEEIHSILENSDDFDEQQETSWTFILFTWNRSEAYPTEALPYKKQDRE